MKSYEKVFIIIGCAGLILGIICTIVGTVSLAKNAKKAIENYDFESIEFDDDLLSYVPSVIVDGENVDVQIGNMRVHVDENDNVAVYTDGEVVAFNAADDGVVTNVQVDVGNIHT